MKIDGWISIHRKLKESPIFMKPPAWFKIWIYLLLEVNHQTGEGFFQWEFIQENCSVTRDQLAECLQFMEEEKMISREKLPRGVKITVQNWLDYQNKKRDFSPTSTPTSKPTSTPISETGQETIKEAEQQDKENFNPTTTPISESTTTPTPINTISNNNINNKEKKPPNEPYQLFQFFYEKMATRDKESVPEEMINKDRELRNAKLLLKKMNLEKCKGFIDEVFSNNGFNCTNTSTLSDLYSRLTNIYKEIKKGGKDGKYISINSIERKGGEAKAGEW